MNVRSGPWMLRRYLNNPRIHELVLSSTRLDMDYDVNAYVTSLLLLRVHVTVSGEEHCQRQGRAIGAVGMFLRTLKPRLV